MAQFFYRVEFGESKLVRDCRRDAFDAAVVQARYVTPDPDRRRSDPDELRAALAACGAPWLIDLGTPQLCDSNVRRVDGCARLRATSFAQLLPLPLDPARLVDADARAAFVDACVAFQTGAPILSAPYLEFDAEDDPRLETNLQMVRRVVGAAGSRLAIGFVQITLDSLKRGLPARVAHRYGNIGARILFLRVRNLKAEAATGEQAAAYQAALEAFSAAGVAIVADQVGRFGAFAVGCGAIGFSGGTQHFRSVPRKAISLGGGGGGPKLMVDIPRKWCAVPRDLAPAEIDCPVPDCPVAAGDRSLDALREHDLHYQRYLAAELAPNLPALLEDLRESGEAQALAWAALLEQRQRRTA